MRIFYPYNEILPKKTAHDVYVFNECSALALQGADVSLLCGKGSWDDAALNAHYQIPIDGQFHIHRLPIVRKNNWLRISWNVPFFFFSQQKIERSQPDAVFLSVLKQGAYHLARKQKRTRYIYEVHQVQAYPTSSESADKIIKEKNVLSRADLLFVTTKALYEILRAPPYSLKNPIEVIPLAVKASSLPPPSLSLPLTLAYVGQLYAGQGIPLLLEAISEISSVHLKIIGGTVVEIEKILAVIKKKGMSSRVQCLGFHPPGDLPFLLKEVHAFVAPFESVGRMPYVAHTKLLEYAEWGRPLIVPDLPIAREHFNDGSGVLFFKAGDSRSLAKAIKQLTDFTVIQKLQQEIRSISGQFTWEKRALQILSYLR